jgi:hypothetical protein
VPFLSFRIANIEKGKQKGKKTILLFSIGISLDLA